MKWGLILLLSLMTCVPVSSVISSDIEYDLGVSVDDQYSFERGGNVLDYIPVNGTREWNNASIYPLTYRYIITEINEATVFADLKAEEDASVQHQSFRIDQLGNLITSIIWDYWYDALESDDISLVYPVPFTALYFNYSYARSDTSFSFKYEYAIEEGDLTTVLTRSAVYDRNDGVATVFEDTRALYVKGGFERSEHLIYTRNTETSFKINAPSIIALLTFPILIVLRKRKG